MMETEKLIHDFIDGSLSGAEEEQLFASLSSSTEMRTELKQQLAIKNAVAQDTRAFTPRAGSEAAIFGALGFGAAATSASAATASSGAGAASSVQSTSLWSRYSQGFIGGIAASVATIIIMLSLGYTNDSNDSIKSIPVVSSESTDRSSEKLAGASSDEVINTDENKAFNESGKNMYNVNSGKNNNSGISSGFFARNFDLPVSRNTKKLNYTNEVRNSDFINKNITPAFAYSEMQQNYANPVSRSINYKELNLMLELNGSGYYSNHSGEMQPSEMQMLNNFGAGIWYKLDEQIKFGINYKRENFYQTFIGIDNNGKVWEYEQQPNFRTFSLDFRYTPDFAKYKMFSPALQISVGGNQAGPVGRMMLGTEIKINPYLNLTAGANYSILGYHHQSRFFTSDKYGLYIGTGVNF